MISSWPDPCELDPVAYYLAVLEISQPDPCEQDPVAYYQAMMEHDLAQELVKILEPRTEPLKIMLPSLT